MKVKDLRNIINELGREYDDLDVATTRIDRWYRPVRSITTEIKDISFNPSTVSGKVGGTETKPMLLLKVKT